MNLRKILLLLPLCIFIFCFNSASAAIVSDNDIKVNIISEGHLPPLIKNRMETSVAVISNQLIDGKEADEINRNKMQYEIIIKDVFNKILVGYTVADVEIVMSDTAVVTVKLLPWDDTIKSVKVELRTDGVSPEIAALALKDIARLPELFTGNLYGLPIDAVDWTNGVLKRSLDEFLKVNLPEFRADFDMAPGALTNVVVTIYPRMPVVRNIKLKMRSESMPNIYLLKERLFLEAQTDILLGVPIAFVDRHKEYFTGKIADVVDKRSSFKAFDMHTDIILEPGETTYITARSDTSRYNIRLEGWADFGRDNNSNNEDITYRLHAGTFLVPKNEVFGQVFFKPQETKIDWAAGYYYHFDNKWRLGTRYFFGDEFWSIDTEKIFNKRWSARFDYAPAKDVWQGAVRYNVHDFISLEYVWQRIDNENEKWLRLIGNF